MPDVTTLPEISRRALLGGILPGAVLAAPAAAAGAEPTLPGPDLALIQAGGRAETADIAITSFYSRYDDAAKDVPEEQARLEEEWDEALAQLTSARARTMDGLAAKASALLRLADWPPECEALAVSIAEDILAMSRNDQACAQT